MTRESITPSRRTLLKTVGVAGFAGLAGCSQQNGDGESPTETNGGVTSTPTEPLRIGVETLLSGPFSIQGEPSRAAAELATQQFNDAGGINGRQVETEIVDSEASPETAITRVREMHQQQDISIIISQSGSSVGRAVSQYCADNNLLNFAGGYSASFTGEDCRRTTFMPFPNLIHILGAHTRVAAQEVEGMRIAGVNPDYSYGRQSWSLFRDNYLDQVDGAEVVAETFPAFGKGDYQQEITTVLDAEPDIVHSSLYAGDMISFIQQAKQYDFFSEVPVFAPSGTYDPVANSLGQDMPEVLVGIPYFYTYPDTPQNNEFASAFIDHFGSPPTGNANNVYNDMLAIKNGIEAAGSSATDDIVDALEGIEFDAPSGTVQIRAADHQGIVEALPIGWGGREYDPNEFPYSPVQDITPVPGSEVVEDPGDCSF